jgi:hypothetical protein
MCANFHDIRRSEMSQQMIALYDVAQEMGKADFVAALELAAEQQMYGAEYVRAIGCDTSAPRPLPPSLDKIQLELGVPAPIEVERSLADYEQYVANRLSVFGLSSPGVEVRA